MEVVPLELSPNKVNRPFLLFIRSYVSQSVALAKNLTFVSSDTLYVLSSLVRESFIPTLKSIDRNQKDPPLGFYDRPHSFGTGT